MFKLKFAKTFDNSVFIKNNIKPVVEDYYCLNDNIFCVADGVTRDSINGTNIIYPETLEEVKEWINIYPNPSGAYEAAKIVANNFVEYIKEKKELNEKIIYEAVQNANKEVWQINKDRKIDYLKDDLFCTVAVGGVIKQNRFIGFSIGDCHITILDENFEIIFETINDHLNFEKYEKETLSKYGLNWENPKDRILVRAGFRNNPIIKDKSFGVLSGEKEAMEFVKTYEVDLTNAKYVCVYSDGCEPNFENKEKIKDTIINPEEIKNSGKEKTLIIFENEFDK